jgi:hypothetical protein
VTTLWQVTILLFQPFFFDKFLTRMPAGAGCSIALRIDDAAARGGTTPPASARCILLKTMSPEHLQCTSVVVKLQVRNKSTMPFELSVLAEATMDVHSVTVDHDTTVEDIKVRRFCLLFRFSFAFSIISRLYLRFHHPYPTLSLLCFTTATYCAMGQWLPLAFSLLTCLSCAA